MRAVSLLLFLGGLAGCDQAIPTLTSKNPTSSTAVPTTEVIGLFRYVCGSDDPLAQLVFPFRKVGDAKYRHSDFDLAFNLSNETCAMTVKPQNTLEAAEALRSEFSKSLVSVQNDGALTAVLPVSSQ